VNNSCVAISTITEVREFGQCRKTCSIIIGNVTASQLRYLNAFIELQQRVLTSCDGTISNQLKWLQNYVEKNKAHRSGIDAFLKSYTSIVNMGMNLISISFDFITLYIQYYTKFLDYANQHSFGMPDCMQCNAL